MLGNAEDAAQYRLLRHRGTLSFPSASDALMRARNSAPASSSVPAERRMIDGRCRCGQLHEGRNLC